MSGHLAHFIGGPEDGKIHAQVQERPHETIDFPKPQQTYWSLATDTNADAMVEIGLVRYRLLSKSFKIPRLYYYEHVEG